MILVVAKDLFTVQVRDIQFKIDDKSKKLELVDSGKRLIITTGDTSDVDGFLALAEYSKVSNGCKCSYVRISLNERDSNAAIEIIDSRPSGT